MTGPAKTQMTLLESMRDDASDCEMCCLTVPIDFLQIAKPTTAPLASSAITEEPGAIFDAHVSAEFVEQSVDATMATMTDTPYVTHRPVMTGPVRRDDKSLCSTNSART